MHHLKYQPHYQPGRMSRANRPNRAHRGPGQVAAQRVVAAVPGWLLLVGGLTLVAMAVLTPAWLENEQLEWQRTVLGAQTEHLTAQADRYVQLHEALAAEDPVLLERLAFVELGLKPVGKTPLLAVPHQPAGAGAHHFAADRPQHAPEAVSLMAVERESIRSVNDWPVRPLPRAGRELPAYEPPNSRLTRLTTGQSRFGLIAAGLLCLLAACYPGMWLGESKG